MKRNQVSGRAYSSPQIQIICLQQEAGLLAASPHVQPGGGGSLTERKDFALDLSASPIDVNKAPNTVLMGNTGDNYTFYMIP